MHILPNSFGCSAPGLKYSNCIGAAIPRCAAGILPERKPCDSMSHHHDGVIGRQIADTTVHTGPRGTSHMRV